jgi:predicted patatin/cPLA2 family phospholipase
VTRRSLILAGGGLKIAYQAGVLQVWLDEAGIEFDSADGTSAACFTLAMWTQACPDGGSPTTGARSTPSRRSTSTGRRW